MLRLLMVIPQAFLFCCLLCHSTLAADQRIPYFSTGFEPEDGYSAGALWESPDWTVQEGGASIARGHSYEGTQHLRLDAADPAASLLFQTDAFAGYPVLILRAWVRLRASEKQDEEFLDWDGALLGFAQSGGHGEFWVAHAVSEQEARVISTGSRVALDQDGRMTAWVQLEVALDRSRGVWSLQVGGHKILENIRVLGEREAKLTQLWLLGGSQGLHQVDRFYLGPAPPDILLQEQETGAGNGSAAHASSRRQVVSPVTRTNQRRSAGSAVFSPARAPRLKGITLTVAHGDHLADKYLDMSRSRDEETPNIMAYGVRRDEDGNPLPIELTLRAEAELAPGVDLSKVRWRVTLVGKNWEEDGEIIASGTFQGNLLQRAVIPAEHVTKATSVTIRVEK